MSKPSKFTPLIEAAKHEPGAVDEAPVEGAGPGKDDAGTVGAAKAEATGPAEVTPPALPQQPPAKASGRPKGKRSDKENYTQVCGYVPTETYKRVRKILRNQEPERQFSDLMSSLLADWLDNQPIA